MARYRGQKALYEVIGRSQPRPKSQRRRLVEALHAPPEPKEQKAETIEPSQVSTRNDQIRWEPRAIQLNSGRVELALPYPVVFVLALALVVAILVAFKLGQYMGTGSGNRQSPDPGQKNTKTGGEPRMQGALSKPTGNEAAQRAASGQTRLDTSVRPGNAVLIQEHRVLEDLVPLKRFFTENGIDTEIIKTGNTFFLVTRERFAANPDRQGPGLQLKQRIIELGAKYQAPPGYARFTGFGDAYGWYFKEQFQGEVVNVN